MTEVLPLHSCHYTESVFQLLGKRWTGLVLDLLLQRPARYNEMRSALPQLSNRMLSERLSELQEAGLVSREVETEAGLTVTYQLTDKGRGLEPAMAALRVWAGAPTDDQGNPLPLTAIQHLERERSEI